MSGNGKVKGNNGKIKRKRGRPKSGKGLDKKQIQNAAIKADGSSVAMAKMLGICPQTAHKHLQKPRIQKAILSARQKAMRNAGITLGRTYQKIAEGMRAGVVVTNSLTLTAKETTAPDYKERRESAKIALQALGELQSAEGGPPVIINMPFVVIDGKNYCFDVGEIINV